jgi:oligopeptidase B
VSDAGPEQVLLDENLLLDDPACGGGYVALGVREVSPDGRLLAYSADFDGDEVYQLRIRDLATGTDLPERMERSYYGLAWSADSRSVFYTVTDSIYRPHQVWRHDVGSDPGTDVCVYTEDDERFEVFVRLSRSGAVIFIECDSRETTETRYILATDTRSAPWLSSPGGAASSTGPIMPTAPTAATCTWSPTTAPPSSGW